MRVIFRFLSQKCPELLACKPCLTALTSKCSFDRETQNNYVDFIIEKI